VWKKRWKISLDAPGFNKIHIVNETYEFITLGGDMSSYVERRYEFIEQTFHMNSYV